MANKEEARIRCGHTTEHSQRPILLWALTCPRRALNSCAVRMCQQGDASRGLNASSGKEKEKKERREEGKANLDT